jgi:hypothetical protein
VSVLKLSTVESVSATYKSDTVEGAKGSGGIASHVERKSRYLQFKQLEEKTGFSIYFADPYSAWQRARLAIGSRDWLCSSMSSVSLKPLSRHFIKARKHFQTLFKGLHKIF